MDRTVMTLPALIPAIAFFVGVLAGVAYFYNVWWTTQRFAGGGKAKLVVLTILLRLALLTALEAGFAIKGGAPALLLCALGVVVGRAWVMRRLKRIA
jgi:F1F0 ATPase subunit 2